MVMSGVINFHATMREAVYDLIDEYKTSADIVLQIYPGRPQSIEPPVIFRDQQNEQPVLTTQGTRQRNVQSIWIALWGLFDLKEAVQQRDAFVDGFSAYVLTNFHKAGGATDLYVSTITDLPVFQPDWGSAEQRNTVYFGTRIVVEGFASG